MTALSTEEKLVILSSALGQISGIATAVATHVLGTPPASDGDQQKRSDPPTQVRTLITQCMKVQPPTLGEVPDTEKCWIFVPKQMEGVEWLLETGQAVRQYWTDGCAWLPKSFLPTTINTNGDDNDGSR